jgi:syntaxin-binding protein 1
VRIVTLYVQFREGVPEEDRRRLYQHARLSLSEQDAVNSLVHFGVRITRVGASSCFVLHLCLLIGSAIQGPTDRDIKRKIKQKRNTEEEYELSRFKPLLQSVLEVDDASPSQYTIECSTSW